MTDRVLEIGNFATDRYAAMHLIPWWEQRRIAAARALVIGAGALGNEVLKNLALLGVGHIAILDRDLVEVSNLTRSVLYRVEDAGRPKAHVAAERVRALNPDVRVVPLHGSLEHIAGVGLIRRVDVVFGCLDNVGGRVTLNRLCAAASTPWIDGSLDVLMGAVRTFVPPHDPCYECSMTEREYALAGWRRPCGHVPDSEQPAGRIPTTPTSASIIAALQVQEWLMLLHGRTRKPGQRIFFEGSSLRMRVLVDGRRSDCPGHQPLNEVVPLSLASDATVAALLAATGAHVGEPCSLLLEHEIVSELECPGCGDREDMFRPYRELGLDALACPRCGAARMPDLVVRLAAPGAADNVPLAQLGVPPLAAMVVETGDGRRIAFELDGDSSTVLPEWPAAAFQEGES